MPIAVADRGWVRRVGPGRKSRRDLSKSRNGHLIVRSQGGGLGDQLLDYITGGPKLRKWYGAEERLPRDGGGFLDEEPEPEPEEEEEEDGVTDAVLVTEASSSEGEQLLIQLILRRKNLKALFSDAVQAKVEYGPYCRPLQASLNDLAQLSKAMRGVETLVILGPTGRLLEAAARCKVHHVVLLTSTEVSQGFNPLAALFDSEWATLCDASREAAVAACSLPHTIIRTTRIQDVPGGNSALEFVADASDSLGTRGAMSREDLAVVISQAIEYPATGARTFEVASIGPGTLPADWPAVFSSLPDEALGVPAS